MAQFKFILWLFKWFREAKNIEFEWDQGNQTKNEKKHGIFSFEAESVFFNKEAIPIGIQVMPIINESRFCLCGLSIKHQVISVIFTFRGDKLRVISARLASKKEKLIYEKIRKAIEGI